MEAGIFPGQVVVALAEVVGLMDEHVAANGGPDQKHRDDHPL
jgi:hypothetical protein